MHYPTVYSLATLCAQKGLQHVVLCPGSRCAPLTLAFARHPHFICKTFSDERSAAFVALGIAQQTKHPTILICTSGSAVYNFAPAIAEAFFSNTPLLVLTADRPTEWIGQQDGQTIFQHGIFNEHVKKSFQLPQTYDHADDQWAVNRHVNEAINLAVADPPGPVHINIPFREPFYPAPEDIPEFSHVRVIEEVGSMDLPSLDELPTDILAEWSSFTKILLVAGQHVHNEELINSVSRFSMLHGVPVTGEIISNLHGVENIVAHTDAFLGVCHNDVKESLQPDLLITFGKGVVSKNSKQFLRNYSPKAHWHIQPTGEVADTFQHLTRIIRTEPLSFFKALLNHPSIESFESQKQRNYYKLWEIEERRMKRILTSFFPISELVELDIVHAVLAQLPEDCNLHLANSMSVRYANLIGLTAHKKNVHVFANRGTSGIDGSNSTAVGHALASERLQILITGDLAFFYDRNAFWHNHPLPNLRIVLLNNHGGIIFKMIGGPAAVPESDEYFVTRQPLTARKLCEEFGFDYLKIDNKRKQKNLIADFLDTSGTVKILEIESSSDLNKDVFQNLKNHLKNSYDL